MNQWDGLVWLGLYCLILYVFGLVIGTFTINFNMYGFPTLMVTSLYAGALWGTCYGIISSFIWDEIIINESGDE